MEPWPTWSASWESCSMRLVRPQPCIGASESVFRMSKSRVPCRTCSLLAGCPMRVPPECREERCVLPPECQGEGRLPARVHLLVSHMNTARNETGDGRLTTIQHGLECR